MSKNTPAKEADAAMRLLDVIDAGVNYRYRWPSGNEELYTQWLEYRAVMANEEASVRVGFGMRDTYGRARKRIVVWIDGKPQAEFLGTDNFCTSGQVLSEIKVPGDRGQRICRWPSETPPKEYSDLPVVGLPTRVTGPGVHKAWAVVANIADHRVMVSLAALRRADRSKR